MKIVELKYVGKHQPPHVVGVDEEGAKKILERGDYVLVEDNIVKEPELIEEEPVEPVEEKSIEEKVEEKPEFEVPEHLLCGKWTEKQIKN